MENDILDSTLKNNNFNTNISLSSVIVGIFVLLLPIPTGSLYGYGVIMFSFIGLLLLNIVLQTKQTVESGMINIIKKLFTSELTPILGLLGIVAWLFSLNIKYINFYNNPSSLPNEFITFKNLSTGLLFISTILIKSLLDKNNGDKLSGETKQTHIKKLYSYTSDTSSLLLYLTLLILSIMVGFMQVILQYFITDG